MEANCQFCGKAMEIEKLSKRYCNSACRGQAHLKKLLFRAWEAGKNGKEFNFRELSTKVK